MLINTIILICSSCDLVRNTNLPRSQILPYFQEHYPCRAQLRIDFGLVKAALKHNERINIHSKTNGDQGKGKEHTKK